MDAAQEISFRYTLKLCKLTQNYTYDFTYENMGIFRPDIILKGNREFDMPFLDASNQEAFQLNKNRSLALYGCCLCSCCMNCNKGCANTCCGYDNDFSNLSVNRNGTKDYYIHQIQDRI